MSVLMSYVQYLKKCMDYREMKQISDILTLEDLIFHNNQDPAHTAIESPGYLPLTYHDLRLQIINVIKTLHAMGFHRNDRIAIMVPDGPEMAVAILSVVAGFTFIPLNPQYKEPEFERYFSNLGIQAVIVQKDYKTAATAVAAKRTIPIIELIPVTGHAGKFELSPATIQNAKEPEFAGPSDIAIIFQTSGTTIHPKIVPISQKQFCLRAQVIYTLYKFTDTVRFLHIVPYYHVIGIFGSLLDPLLAGGTVICIKDFIAADFIYLLKTCRPTCYVAVPAIHQAILREIKKVPPDELKNHTLSGIRSGSASLPEHVRNELETILGIPVIEVYGMTEAAFISINFPHKRNSAGIPVIGSLAILDDDGNMLPPNEKGEIIVKGERVFNGYENAPEENKIAFINGWYKTGDIGYIDHDGYLFLTGRKKELINKGGRKISPNEIDAVLESHQGVKEAMSFQIKDRDLGEDIAAMVVPADPRITEKDLRSYLLDRLVQFKVPRRIYFVDKIPKTPTGKPMRYVGTQRYSG
jgi:oxalate---CoA ligase